MAFPQASPGPSSFGYTRGTERYRGSGSGMGPAVAGTGQYAQGQGTVSGTTSSWTPDIVYLFILVIAEMAVFGYLSRRI